MLQEKIKRVDGRYSDQMRDVSIQHNAIGYSAHSVFYEQGKTKVLCSVTLNNKVPMFLKKEKKGWLTAEYNMLPCATRQRTIRDSSMVSKNSRGVEISRLIGRCLRSTVDLSILGEKTIVVDCDVLQADGGTRVACITAASLALKHACLKWFVSGITEINIFKEQIAAISIGFVNDKAFVDMSFTEDNNADVDFNFVISKSNNIVEIQGTGEKKHISWDSFEDMKKMAIVCVSKLFNLTENVIIKNDISKKSLFSIGNRIGK